MPAMLVKAHDAPIHVRLPGRILRNDAFRPGARVIAGQALLILEAPNIAVQMQQARLREKVLSLRLARIAADPSDRSQRTVLLSDLSAVRETIAGLQRLQRDLIIRAPFSGNLVDVDPHLHAGRWLRPADRIGRIVGDGAWSVRALAGELAAERCAAGASGRFIPDDASQPSIPVTLRQIAKSNERTIVFPSLAIAHGGWIAAASDKRDALTPLTPVFAADFSLAEQGGGDAMSARGHAMRGVVVVDSAPESILYGVWRQIARVLVRESGF